MKNNKNVIFTWKQEDFDKLYENVSKEPVTPYIIKYFSKSDSLLEAGCGSGRFVHYLNNLGYKIIGLEIGNDTVKILNEKFPQLDIIEGDVRELPFPDKHFKGIISLGVIEHIIEGLEKPIDEMHRVLKEDGIAIVIVPSFNTIRKIKYYSGYYHLKGHIKRLTILRKIFKKPSKNEFIRPQNPKYRYWNILTNFYEYRLSKDEFESLLIERGFEIIESVPTSQIDGIYIELGSFFVKLSNHTFYPNILGHFLNKNFSKTPFFHNHMHLCIVKKKKSIVE